MDTEQLINAVYFVCLSHAIESILVHLIFFRNALQDLYTGDESHNISIFLVLWDLNPATCERAFQIFSI
jgi:hypothetical protein